jgi:hypothetical protein
MNSNQNDSLDDEDDDNLASSMVVTKYQLFYVKISLVFFV